MNITDGPGERELKAPGAGSVGVCKEAGTGDAGVDASADGDAEVETGAGPGTGQSDVFADATADTFVGVGVGAGSGWSEPAGLSTVRLRLDLSYDGTNFSGWAEQPGRRTVAGDLGVALNTLFRCRVPLVVAGRTDAGVHAAGQVAHIDVLPASLTSLARRPQAGVPESADPLQRGCFGLLRRLAGLLATDVRVRAVTVAPEGFDARFAALRRHYRYRVAATGFGAEPLRRLDTVAWPRPLDVDAMAQAALTLLGLRDFAAYCKPAHEGASTIRELQALTVLTLAEEPGVIVFDVSADAFCHSMVRSLVGALLAVGEGRISTDRPLELLAAGRRTGAITAAPAHGLTLVRVDYPAVDQLGARALMTRAVRRSAHDQDTDDA